MGFADPDRAATVAAAIEVGTHGLRPTASPPGRRAAARPPKQPQRRALGRAWMSRRPAALLLPVCVLGTGQRLSLGPESRRRGSILGLSRPNQRRIARNRGHLHGRRPRGGRIVLVPSGRTLWAAKPALWRGRGDPAADPVGGTDAVPHADRPRPTAARRRVRHEPDHCYRYTTETVSVVGCLDTGPDAGPLPYRIIDVSSTAASN